MRIELDQTEQNIVSALQELKDDYSFKAFAHPGSIMQWGFPITFVSAIVQFNNITNDRPDNLLQVCPSYKSFVNFTIYVVYNDYRSHRKLYPLAKEMCRVLRGRKLLTFCEGERNTELYSFIDNFSFIEIDDGDNGCYGYSFRLTLCYMDSYQVKI